MKRKNVIDLIMLRLLVLNISTEIVATKCRRTYNVYLFLTRTLLSMEAIFIFLILTYINIIEQP